MAELFVMIMVCHNLNPKVPSDVAFSESRVRPENHRRGECAPRHGCDLHVLSSDSQAMGRVGENWLRAIQTADAMKKGLGKLPEGPRITTTSASCVMRRESDDQSGNHPGRSRHVLGSISPGENGGPCPLQEPTMFGAKPKMVIKGGLINWSIMGDPNASLPTPQPVIYRPMFGAFGQALPETCVSFVSRAAYDNGIANRVGPQTPKGRACI